MDFYTNPPLFLENFESQTVLSCGPLVGTKCKCVLTCPLLKQSIE